MPKVEGETKEERKERKRLKKLAKEAKKAAKADKKSKKRKLEELDDVAEEPASKKRKVESEAVDLSEITKSVASASESQIQQALLQTAKAHSTNSDIAEKVKSPEIDAETTELLNSEVAAAAETGDDAKASGSNDPKTTSGKFSGTMGRWNHEKAFGFITRDDGGEDVFCHISECWLEDGVTNVKTGEKVEFTVEQQEQGSKASDVQAVGGGACTGGKMFVGTVKNWLDDRGFGFIGPDGGSEDHFCMGDQAYNTGGRFNPGDRVEYDLKTKQSGKTAAVYVTLIGGVCKQCSICEEFGHMSRNCPTMGKAPAGAVAPAGGNADANAYGATPGAPAAAAPVKVDRGPTPEPTEGKTLGEVISWRHERGFGFIKIKDTEEEVFCHVKSLKCDYGDRNAKCGSKVEFDVEEGDKGKSAINVCWYGGGNVVGGRTAGTMMRFMADRGFGFIQPDGGGDQVFAGDRDIWTKSGTFTDGDRVEFDIKVKKTSGKICATYVTLEHEEVKDHSADWAAAEEGAEEGAEEY